MSPVRAAAAADVSSVVELWRRAAGPTRLASDDRAVERLLARDPDALLVAEIDGEVVGTLIVGWDGWRCHLYRMAVDPAFRRRQVGRDLLLAAADRAAQLGARRLDAMVTDDNVDGIAFWKDAGFEPDVVDHRWSRPCD